MKKILIASACVMALSTAAYAQTQPAPGASSEGNVGPGTMSTQRPMGTTGMDNGMVREGRQPSAAGDASNSGAPTSAGVNSTGPRTDPGAVKNGANGR
jgi:hypothetical protein